MGSISGTCLCSRRDAAWQGFIVSVKNREKPEGAYHVTRDFVVGFMLLRRLLFRVNRTWHAIQSLLT